ncbi:MAG: 16S rRNA (uracil(1498)-N(3))-methyltransferase [Pseudomonadota bacterium]
MTRLYSETPLAGRTTLILDAAEAHYAVRVLRLAPGHDVVLFDGRGGEYRARIEAVERRRVELVLGEYVATDRLPALATTLIQGIASGARMDVVVQKATELGVTRIVPVITERSQRRPGRDRRAQRLAHWQRVALAACRQCGRNRLPGIAEPLPLADWLAAGRAPALRLLLSPAAAEPLRVPERPAAIELLIGPEGGFADHEAALARDNGFTEATLGPRILRTETAAIAALAALRALTGETA